MRGRTPRTGTAGDALLRAYEQKQAMRSLQPMVSAVDGGAGAASTAWTPLGPAPLISDTTGSTTGVWGYVSGRISAIAVDPNDSTGNTVYVGGASGGIWKSLNATTTPANVQWTALTDDQATLSTGAIAVQPGNGNVVLVGTGEANTFSYQVYYGLGLLRSTDGGNNWSLITSADSGAHPFRGYAFSSIAFSTDSPNLVVAGVSGFGNGSLNGAIATTNNNTRGLYYSTDAGATWHAGNVHDGSFTPDAASIGSVVYNASNRTFYAALRFHGFYSSTDGINWTRLANQPGTLTTINCPATVNSQTCLIGRGQITVRRGANEMYVWIVDDSENNQGIYKTTDGGATWAAINTAGIDSCGDSDGCSTSQGLYNLVLTAVPNGTGTDLYAGAINVFKCSLAAGSSACSGSGWLNLTHVYGCPTVPNTPMPTHPDQHAIEFVGAHPEIIYFGNDGGIYRTTNGPGLNSGACTAVLPGDDLNATLGSLTQFIAMASHPTNQNQLLGGTQDNGSPGVDLANAGANGTTWKGVQSGDGGFSVINPSNGSDWFAEVPYFIARCPLGPACTDADFNTVVDNTTLDGDSLLFFTPYVLDPGDLTKLIVGSCRIWRGPASGAGWTYTANHLSPDFDSYPGAIPAGQTAPTADGSCAGNEYNNVRALAAGGPATSSGSQVIYAGTEFGRVFVTTNAAAGPSSWVDVTAGLNTQQYEISSIAVDSSDATGKTAYVTVMGFDVPHVYKTTSAGASWADITGNLPNAPANSVLIDPTDATTVYVATDVGVYVTHTNAAGPSITWALVGPSAKPGNLPNVPVLQLSAFNSGTTKLLRAATFGRGIWQFSLSSATAAGTLSFDKSTVGFGNQTLNTTSAAQTVTVTASIAAVTFSSAPSLGGANAADFAISNNTCSGTLNPGSTCAISVTFRPSATGPRSAAITVASNGTGSPQTISLTGNGISGTGNVIPQNGWWYDPNLSGIGFFIEYGGKSGNGIFMAGFLYDASGKATWLVSSAPMTTSTYSGPLTKVVNGQPLLGPYQAGTSSQVGTLSITFTDPTHGVMTRPNGTTINIQRFGFTGATTIEAPEAGTAQVGWWWGGAATSGTGYGIEWQNNTAFVVVFTYDTAGNPVWYLALGPLTSPTVLNSNWTEYKNGPQFTSPEGSYPTTAISPAFTDMSMTFSDATHGTLKMNGGTITVPIVRFQEF